MKQALLFVAILFFFDHLNIAKAQFSSELYKSVYPSTQNAQSGSLYLSFSSSSFFRNAEYFNPYIDGFTLLGAWVEPKLTYYFSENSKFFIGANALKYSGRDDFAEVLPVIGFRQTLTPSVDVQLGTLEGSLAHRLPEPLFAQERWLQKPVENGLQFLIHTPRLQGDVWINWEHFIMDGDSAQERFTQGTSLRFSAVNGENFQLEIPFYAMFFHRGGQINNSEVPIETLNNFSSGFKTNWNVGGEAVKRLGFNLLAFAYNNLSPQKKQLYSNGWGIMPSLQVVGERFMAEAGYWYGYKFIGPRGDGMYSSISAKDLLLRKPERSMPFVKLLYGKRLDSGVGVYGGAECFYDSNSSKLDYTYSLYITFSRDFLLGHPAFRP
jgi:hypothetical protein